jgi:CBS domain-containing protein
MLVQSIMKSPAFTISASTPLVDAARLMLDKHISGLPVVDSQQRLVGIITESDFLRRRELGTERRRSRWLTFFTSPGKMADEYVHSHGRTVEEVMSWPVETVTPHTEVSEAAALMERRHIKRLPVVADETVVGIVSRSDFMRALARATPGGAATSVDDARIEAAIIKEIAKQPWSRTGRIDVSVTNGEAELSGTIFDERERIAARVAAENIDGVRRVVDRLVWIEPNFGVAMVPPDGDA